MDTKAGKIVVRPDPEIRELIPGFLANRRSDVETIRTALEKGDFKTIAVLGHTMKGDGGGYGFEAISVIGGVLEAAAKRKDASRIGQELERLTDYLDRVEVTYS